MEGGLSVSTGTWARMVRQLSMKQCNSKKQCRSAGRFFALLLVFGACLLVESQAYACSVCFGNPEGKITDALNLAILTLIGCIGFVLLSISVFMVYLARRGKEVSVSLEANKRD